MREKLLPPVNKILALVEKQTNKTFQFVEKEDLMFHGGIKLARNNISHHEIYYNKGFDSILNHIIAHECGHALRIFDQPEEKRLIPASVHDNKMIAYQAMEADIKKLKMTVEVTDEIKDIWHGGLVRQVTNQPADLMIERWLFKDYPELREVQKISIQKQHTESMQGLSADVKKMTPKKVLDVSNVMNYVYFKLLGGILGQSYIQPYSQFPDYLKKGEFLAQLTQSNQVDDYLGDISMSNVWAEYLDIHTWFKWVGFEVGE